MGTFEDNTPGGGRGTRLLQTVEEETGVWRFEGNRKEQSVMSGPG